ncbi:MAG: hypothetical protein V3U73_15225 [bacterium]
MKIGTLANVMEHNEDVIMVLGVVRLGLFIEDPIRGPTRAGFHLN